LNKNWLQQRCKQSKHLTTLFIFCKFIAFESIEVNFTRNGVNIKKNKVYFYTLKPRGNTSENILTAKNK
jgi:hypothetical protein